MTPILLTPIVVTGGTGTLGRLVVRRLLDADQSVRVLSRHGGTAADRHDRVEYVRADLTTGDGLPAALAGVEIVVHLAGAAKGDEQTTRTLVDALRADGRTTHLVVVSVVGADAIAVRSRLDRLMFGYYAEKAGAERAVEASGLPWTILRATQFHDFVLTTLDTLARLPVMLLPRSSVQSVEADEVAARLVELTLGEPAGRVPDLAGPETMTIGAGARSYLRATGKHRALLTVTLPGGAARAMADGGNLAATGDRGVRTWAEFLADRTRR